jgi:pimeloyl-ACP methyl ester carboxylesterase
MPFTALPKVLLCPRCTSCWAAVFLLSCYLGSRLNADEGAKPPLPAGVAEPDTFRSEDLIIPAGDLQLAGTLYVPLSGQPAPAVVFVHGAGPAVRGDRYHELARHFARKGVASLIYDKRGCGASTGDWTRAGLYDLAEDALACVRLLRSRPEIKPTQVGLWGLSQGASIIPIAAGQSPEVAFVIAVGGCLDFEGQMRYFRANLFRRHGHPPAALDIANKTFLIQVDLSNRIRSGSLPAPRALQDSCRFEFDLDQAAVWRQVRQPILAIYGEKDRHVPLAENIAGLSAAVEQSGNRDFTLIIYPNASHSIGKTLTGELGEQWTGYVPEYLDDMTDWVLQQVSGVKRPEGWPQRGRVAESDRHFPAEQYDRLRWYGNAPVQAIQFIVFAVVFLVGAVAGAVRLVRGRRRDLAPTVTRVRNWLTPVATGVSVLNLALLTGLVALTLGLANQLEPSYPGVLNWLPLAGSLSVGLTLTLLALLGARWRALADSRRKRIGWVLFAICAIAFVPFLHYWNLLGLAWR